jgi:hypothetical protein
MYARKLFFAQVMEFAPWHTFRRLVAKYRGNFTRSNLADTNERCGKAAQY